MGVYVVTEEIKFIRENMFACLKSVEIAYHKGPIEKKMTSPQMSEKIVYPPLIMMAVCNWGQAVQDRMVWNNNIR